MLPITSYLPTHSNPTTQGRGIAKATPCFDTYPSCSSAACTIGYVTRFAQHLLLVQRMCLSYIWIRFASASISAIILFSMQRLRRLVEFALPEHATDIVNHTLLISWWAVKNRLAGRFGGVFLDATPGGIFCNVADASLASQIFGMR